MNTSTAREPRLFDCRTRPPFRGLFDAFAPQGDTTRMGWINRRLGGAGSPETWTRDDLTAYFAEFEQAGTRRGLALARTMPGVSVDNADIAELCRQYPDRLSGCGVLDVTGESADPLDTLRQVVELGLAGVTIEPGVSTWGAAVDDERLFGIYAEVERLGLPLVLMTGPFAGPDLDLTHPRRLQRVFARFPGITIVLAHGAWPWVDEVLAVALRQENLYVCPDAYLPFFMDRIRPFLDTPVRNQLLYGSGYPYKTMAAAAEHFWGLGLPTEVEAAIGWENAERLFGSTPR